MKVTWLSHEFEVYEKVADWYDVAGVYIFAGLNNQNQWVPLYVGQTNSFHTRIPSHEKWSRAVLIGATRVHARVESLEATRLVMEQELIQAYDPQLNRQ